MTARSRLLSGLFLLAFLSSTCPAAIPSRDGHINDGVGIFTPASRASFERRLDAFHREKGVDIAVLVLRALDAGDDRGTYARDVFDAWRLGAPGCENGLLLVVALQDHLIDTQQNTLTPGEDLQGVLRDTILPAFREGYPTMGLEKGLDALMDTLLPKPPPFAGVPRPLWAPWVWAAIVALLAALPWWRLFALREGPRPRGPLLHAILHPVGTGAEAGAPPGSALREGPRPRGPLLHAILHPVGTGAEAGAPPGSALREGPRPRGPLLHAILHLVGTGRRGRRPSRLRSSDGTELGTLLLPACLLLLVAIFVMPPFQVPDEANHFYRAWQVSRGGWTGVRQGQESGGAIPRCLVRTVCGVTDDVGSFPDHKVDRRWLAADWRAPFDYHKTVFYDFSNTAMQSPVTYLPQAGGMALGRRLRLPPLGLLYAARLANALAAVALLWLAVRLAPRVGPFLLVAAWMPMAAHLMGSASPDALTDALAFLFAALVYRACERRPSRALWAGLYATAIALGLCKLVYAPLALLALAIPASTGFLGGTAASRSASARVHWHPIRRAPRPAPLPALGGTAASRSGQFSLRTWMAAAGVVLAGAAAAWVWGPFAARAYEPLVAGGFASLGEARTAMLADPLHYAGVAWNTLRENGLFSLASMIGVLGCIDTPLPGWFLAAYGALLAAAAAAAPWPRLSPPCSRARERVDLPPPHGGGYGRTCLFIRGGALLLVVIVVSLVFAAQCATFLPAGGRVLEGHQGRYFIPLLPLAVFIAGGWRWSARVPLRWAMPVAASAAVVSLGMSLYTVLCRYYWA